MDPMGYYPKKTSATSPFAKKHTFAKHRLSASHLSATTLSSSAITGKWATDPTVDARKNPKPRWRVLDIMESRPRICLRAVYVNSLCWCFFSGYQYHTYMNCSWKALCHDGFPLCLGCPVALASPIERPISWFTSNLNMDGKKTPQRFVSLSQQKPIR